MKDFRDALREVPEKPGVYLMRDAEDVIIYVGKAISLRRRVRSYFTPSRHGKSPKVLAMVEHVERFEYIVVDNEVEALVLESNFIKEHRPKYNILLRDDKQYPYIEVPKEKFPRLLKVRHAGTNALMTFGPFPNAYAVNDTIRLMQRLFGIRTCKLDFDRGQSLPRPCLQYDLGHCPAPCVGKADEETYMQQVAQVAEVLRGRDRELREALTQKMHEAADQLEFERAARFRDDLRNLDALQEKQKVTFTDGKDADVIALARGSSQVTMQVFFVRGGRIVDRESFLMDEAVQEEASAILASFLKQFYLEAPYIPAEILLDEMPDDADAITAFLEGKRGQRVTLRVPKRGDKHELLLKAEANAAEALEKAEKREDRKERNKDRGITALEEIIGKKISRVEAYDISNISGVQNVGSMVVYERERKRPQLYRKFKIRTVDGPNEYASQREMLERRFDHGLKDRAEGKHSGFEVFPDVLLMDGGKGQVHVAEDVLRARSLDIPVAGLVKDDKHTTRALMYHNEEFALDPRTPLYKYLYAVQEEVHRFAIAYHRKLRSQDMTHSELDEIAGIGSKRRRALLQALGSVDAIARADVESLSRVAGMTKTSAEAVWAHFQKQKNESKGE